MWIYYFVFFFFFSSRRRHTRCGRDWSSDGALPISQSNTHFLLVSLSFWLYRYRDYRLREVHTLKNDWLVDRAQGIPCGHIFHTNQRCNITSTRSEERRVGKECRGRWWRGHEKKDEK